MKKIACRLFKPFAIAALFFAVTGSCLAQNCNIIVEAATLSNNGIVEIPGPHGATAFALSTTNIGSTCGVNILPRAFGPNGGAVPVTVTLLSDQSAKRYLF